MTKHQDNVINIRREKDNDITALFPAEFVNYGNMKLLATTCNTGIDLVYVRDVTPETADPSCPVHIFKDGRMEELVSFMHVERKWYDKLMFRSLDRKVLKRARDLRDEMKRRDSLKTYLQLSFEKFKHRAYEQREMRI
jgi:hypothetical protein